MKSCEPNRPGPSPVHLDAAAEPRRRTCAPARAGIVGVGLLGLGTGCIIPDRGIRSEGDEDNPGAVRIVEPIPVLPELLEVCNDMGPDGDPRYCPQVPETTVQGLLGGGPFCSCPGRDENRYPELSVWAEDPDRRGDDPADVLYAVALLDMVDTDAPQNFVAYTEHLTPGGRGEYLPPSARATLSDENPLVPSPGREDNGLWRFRFGKDGGEGTDLCNDDDGETLAVGLHNLQIMVTDRPFFQPVRLDNEGNPVGGDEPVYLPTQLGMPHLGIGATWDVANYVFLCEDPADQPDCACAEEVPP